MCGGGADDVYGITAGHEVFGLVESAEAKSLAHGPGGIGIGFVKTRDFEEALRLLQAFEMDFAEMAGAEESDFDHRNFWQSYISSQNEKSPSVRSGFFIWRKPIPARKAFWPEWSG